MANLQVRDIDNSLYQSLRHIPFGHLKAKLKTTGSIAADMDLIIASTALTHNLILVTNNEKHFQHVPELQVENWAT